MKRLSQQLSVLLFSGELGAGTCGETYTAGRMEHAHELKLLFVKTENDITGYRYLSKGRKG
jgi:hypothetical protein